MAFTVWWEKSFNTWGGLSCSKDHKRLGKITSLEEEQIKTLRKKNIEYGKKKLKVLYKTEYGETISAWKIERVIRKWNLYPKPVEHKKKVEKQRKSASKVRINTVKEQLKEVNEFGFLWQYNKSGYSTLSLDLLMFKRQTLWLIKYYSYRPHETLDYLTPLAYAQENFFKVSPMWSARTSSCFLVVYILYFSLQKWFLWINSRFSLYFN